MKVVVFNRVFYAATSRRNGGKCFNDDFGVASVLGVISSGAFLGYGKDRWNEVMENDVMRPLDVLQKLDPAKQQHLALCMQAAKQDLGAAPVAIDTLGGTPVAFNRAANQPPNKLRMAKLGKVSVHTFYGFIPGRECA